MNKRYLIVLSFVLLLTACVIVIYIEAHGSDNYLIKILDYHKKTATRLYSPVTAFLPVPSVSALPTTPTITIGQVMAPMFQTPIEFYGRVLNDKNMPVPDVSIEFQPITAYSLGENSSYVERFMTTSDSNGDFMIKNIHGSQLYVKIQKEGFLPRDLGGDIKTVGFGEVGGHSVVGGADPVHPLIFYLKPLLSREHVLRNQFDVDFEFNKVTGQCNVAKVTNLAGVQCLITAQYQTDFIPKSFTTPHNWSLTLQIPSGGFLPLYDPDSQLAPTSGYRDTEVIQMQTSDKNWSWQTDRLYYIKLPGPYFAKIRLGVSTENSREPWFTIFYTLNPKKNSPYLSADSQDGQTVGGF